MAFPPGPMQPGQGHFEGVAIGAPLEPMFLNDYHQNDYGQQQRRGVSPDPFYNPDSDVWPKKNDSNKNTNKNNNNKNKNGQQTKSSVEIKYEGYVLEKLDPLPGESTTWARAGKRTLPFSDKRLQDLVKQHRQKTRQGPLRDFEQLSSNQQGTINRLIAQRKLNETNKKADWVLSDVQWFGKRHWTKQNEVKKIQVILKRQEKFTATEKNNINRRESKSYQQYEIIDLDDPLENKKGNNSSKQAWDYDDLEALDDQGFGGGKQKKKTKKNGQNRDDDDFFHGYNDRGGWNDGDYGRGGGHHGGGGGGGGGGNDFQHPLPPPMNHGFPQQQPQPQPIPMPMYDQFNGPMHGQPVPQQQFDPHGPPGFPPAPQPPLARQPSARQQPMFTNPFQSEQFVVHDQYDSPTMMNGEDFMQVGDRERRRSKSLRRRSSTRRPSINDRKFSELEDRVDELTSRIRDWQVGGGGSSDDSFEGDSASSRHHDERNYSTPGTSHFSRRGSLDRKYNPERPRYRSRRYTDADIDIEPAYTWRSKNNGTRAPRRHRSVRPNVHHTHSVDDYPFGRAAKPRYLPAPPPRAGEFDEQYDYEARGGSREERPVYRRSGGSYESFNEGYEAARRDLEGRELRRHRSVGRSHWD